MSLGNPDGTGYLVGLPVCSDLVGACFVMVVKLDATGVGGGVYTGVSGGGDAETGAGSGLPFSHVFSAGASVQVSKRISTPIPHIKVGSPGKAPGLRYVNPSQPLPAAPSLQLESKHVSNGGSLLSTLIRTPPWANGQYIGSCGPAS